MKGFKSLSTLEIELLSLFNLDGELYFPNYKMPDYHKTLNSLKHKGLVKGSRPFKLTKPGTLAYHELVNPDCPLVL